MKVSVITVCYNSSKTILDTINSINKQTYLDIEHVFVDGQSKDSTLKIIKENSKRNPTFISEPDSGIYDAMNKGILLCKGEVVFIINSDDVLYDKFTIKNVIEAFERNPKSDIIFGSIKISEQNNLFQTKRNWKATDFIKNSFIRGWHPPHPGFVVKKKCYDDFGLFNASYKIASDFNLMYRFLEVNKIKATRIDEYIAILRGGGASMKYSGIIKGQREIRQTFKENSINLNMLVYMFNRYISKIIQYK